MPEHGENVEALIIMGVSGTGKTTLGEALVDSLGSGWMFIDGDDLHPPANTRKMQAGIPLEDADRWGWLDQVASVLHSKTIIACSALKADYRKRIFARAGCGQQKIGWVFLHASEALLAERIRNRGGDHFFPAALLASQLSTLEEPAESEGLSVLKVSCQMPTSEQVSVVKQSFIKA